MVVWWNMGREHGRYQGSPYVLWVVYTEDKSGPKSTSTLPGLSGLLALSFP